MTQSETNELKVTYMTRVPLKFAYLTDQDGTILDYKDGGWDTGNSRLITFSWGSNMQPTRLVPHIVYEESCADVSPSEAKQTWVRQAPPLTPTPPGRAARPHALHHARATMAASASGLCVPTISAPASLTQRHLPLPSQRTQLALMSEKYDARSPSPIRPSGRAL